MPIERYRYAASIDADGTIFNPAFLNKYRHSTNEPFPAALITENSPLLAHLIREMHQAMTKEIVIGSARQSFGADKMNANRNKTPLFVDSIRQMGNHLVGHCPGIELNTYLLADAYADVPDGTSFRRAILEDRDKIKHHNRFSMDEKKITLLYSQMHNFVINRMSLEEDYEDTFTFDFFDDRDDILSALTVFFTANPEKIPPRLTLRLFKYQYGHIIKTWEFSGIENSIVDYCHRTTKTRMLELNSDKTYHVIPNPDLITWHDDPESHSPCYLTFPLFLGKPDETEAQYQDSLNAFKIAIDENKNEDTKTITIHHEFKNTIERLKRDLPLTIEEEQSLIQILDYATQYILTKEETHFNFILEIIANSVFSNLKDRINRLNALNFVPFDKLMSAINTFINGDSSPPTPIIPRTPSLYC